MSVRTFTAVDDGAATQGIACYTADATLDRYGELSVGTDAIRAVLAAREAQRDRITCHAVVNYLFHAQDEDRAEASYALLVMLVAGDITEVAGVRTCQDTYRRVGGRWLVAHRRQRYLGTP